MKIDYEINEHFYQTFFLWLLTNSEINDGGFEVEGEYLTLRIEDKLSVTGEGDCRKIVLTQGVPSVSAEAKACFKTRKLPSVMKMSLTIGEDNYKFTINSSTMEIKSINLPAVLTKEIDLRLDERMFHLNQIFRVIQALFVQFVEVMTDEKEWEYFRNEFTEWVS